MLKWQNRYWSIIAGLILILFGLGFRTATGIGPYQIAIIIIGIMLILLGISQSDSILNRVALVCLSIIATLCIIEGALMVLKFIQSDTFPSWQIVNDYSINDDNLLFRISPQAPEHDANGWRNPSALDLANFVTLGDSHTWGINADSNETWPLALAQIIDESVYNMGMGGYGPIDYLALMPEALEHNPQHIIVGLYFGNDILDSIIRVYSLDAYEQFRSGLVDEKQTAIQITRNQITVNNARRTEILSTLPTGVKLDILKQFYYDTAIGHYVGDFLRNVWNFDDDKYHVTVDENPDIYNTLSITQSKFDILYPRYALSGHGYE